MEGETILSFTIGRLRDLLVTEGVYLQALTGPVEELREKLTQMEELLEYAHVRRDKRTAEIMQLADHLMDSIEKYVFRVVSKVIGVREHFLRLKVRLAIENVITKISDLVNSQSGDVDASCSGPRRMYKVQDLSYFNEKDFVGREEDVDILVSYLVDEEYEWCRVISIYGMGGLGKTTLARKVYKDKKVLSHYNRFAFVCVTEECQAEEILKHILQQLVPETKEDINSMPEEDVIYRLKCVQQERKCLVVIDDIWSVSDWESLDHGLPRWTAGSKVLLTTRIKDVADKGLCYTLECLSEDECWELFQKKIFTGRDSLAEQRMEELGRKMIAWCRGIPLAVLVIRGVLVTKGSLPEWERFYNSRTWGGREVEKFNGEVAEELLFSYKELPYPLRPCFLYLANFAEDVEIEAEMLYRLWDAEGFILSKDREAGETMMDVAERYLGELVGRSMVEAKLEDEVRPNVRRRFESCWLHDLMRGLCLTLVKNENFLKVDEYYDRGDKQVVLNSSCLRNDSRVPLRQALYFSPNQVFSVHDKQEANRHVRSLIFKRGEAKKLFNVNKMKLLRVLSFDFTSIGNKDFTGELIHLRYFRLFWCNIRGFTSTIENLTNLQTLDMRIDFSNCDVLVIPYLAIRKMKRLKHLFLPDEYFYEAKPESCKLRLDGLTELETLVNFDSTKCEMKDVIQLTNIRRLECKICISSEDKGGVELKKFMEKMNLDPSQNSALAIVLENPEKRMYSHVLMGQLIEYCKRIFRELRIIGLRVKLFPAFFEFVWITKLTLQEFEVEEDPMPTLEILLNLRRLYLWDVKLKGNEMACSSMGFPQLRNLYFWDVEHWKNWRMEIGAMPKLILLSITGCKSLEMLPDELEFVTTLDYLKIERMPIEFVGRLICGDDGGEGEGPGPEFYKIQHVRIVTIEDQLGGD